MEQLDWLARLGVVLSVDGPYTCCFDCFAPGAHVPLISFIAYSPSNG